VPSFCWVSSVGMSVGFGLSHTEDCCVSDVLFLMCQLFVEFRLSLMSDENRVEQLLSSLAHKCHPLSKFMWGWFMLFS